MEMIQAVVTRLASNSFLIKGWSITVAGLFFGFAVKDEAWDLALAGLLPTFAFWLLDSFFLRWERLFRVWYDQVRTGDPKVDPFFMGATSPAFAARVTAGDTAANPAVASWWKTFWRATLVTFYGVLVVSNLLVVALICLGGN